MNVRKSLAWMLSGAALLAAPLLVGAQDASTTALPGTDAYRMLVVAAGQGPETTYVADDAGRRVRIDGFNPQDPTKARLLIPLLDATQGWPGLTAQLESAGADKNGVRLRIVPATLLSSDVDYTSYVPSGLVFVSDGSRVEYDFRLKVGGYFIRFQGVLQNYRSLMERMAAAVADPAGFIRDNDPDFLIRRVSEMQLEADRAAAERRELAERLDDLTDQLGKTNELLEGLTSRLGAFEVSVAESADQLVKEMKTAEADIYSKISADEQRAYAWAAQTEEGIAKLDEKANSSTEKLETELSALGSDVQKNSAATAAVFAKGLFGSPKSIDAALIKRVLALRAEQPTLPAASIPSTLKAEGLTISASQVKAILAVFLGEY